jgi:hypothetical protein
LLTRARATDEVYYQVFRGLISPGVIAPLATGNVYEQAPLCGSSPEVSMNACVCGAECGIGNSCPGAK